MPLFVLGSLVCDVLVEPFASYILFVESWVGFDRIHLRDDMGRVVILRGVNVCVDGIFDVSFDDGWVALEEIPELVREDVVRMCELGLSVLRLSINWLGVELEEGAYDEVYLDRVEEVVDWCVEVGVHVIVDFH